MNLIYYEFLHPEYKFALEILKFEMGNFGVFLKI